MSAHESSEVHDEHALPEGHEAPPPGVRVLAAVRWLLVALAAVAAAYTLARHYGLVDASPMQHAANSALYHCPMHPTVIQDRPGDCPICNMALVPIENDAPGPSSKAQHDGMPHSAQDPTAQAKTARVEHSSIAPTLSGFARVALDERGITSVHTRVPGFIQTLRVAETGRLVQRGDILATLYSPELLGAQRELLAAERWQHQAGAEPPGTLAIEARSRLQSLGVATEDIAAMLARGVPDSAVPLRSPARGVVTRKNVTLGAYVEPEMTLYELADAERVWVIGEISERDAQRVMLGARAEIALADQPPNALTGSVDLLYPSLDAARRTREVRIKLDAGAKAPSPGTTGRISIATPMREALTIPVAAIVDRGGSQLVFVTRKQGGFEPRTIETGGRMNDRIEVLTGLSLGDEVVTSPTFLFDAESQIRGGIEAHEGTIPASEVGHDHAHP